MLTYMASCGSTTCDKFDDTQAKWFKISEDGKTPGDNSTWLQQRLSVSSPSSLPTQTNCIAVNGGVANSTIPSNLAPGNYLLRHEIIALHLATSLGGAEFYPACAQITVGGSQSGAPSASDLVSIPGAYSDNDPGIFDPNVFTPDAPYVFPGPPIASFITGSSSSGSGSTASTAGAASPTTTGAATASSASGKTCRIQKRAVNNDEVDLFVVRPRHLSRIMRRLAESMH